MSKLYIDCNMGAAGDMIMASLYELLDDKKGFLDKMNSLGIPNVEIIPEFKLSNGGISGTKMKVLVKGEEEGHEEHGCGHHHGHSHCHHHGHEHHHSHEGHHDHSHSHEHHEHKHEHHSHSHRGLKEIIELINNLDLPEEVKEDAVTVFFLISQAESIVHNKPMEDIHFHEVGTYDAVADVVGSCLLMNMLGYPEVIASPIHVGSGTVKCAHGILPVPAPATTLILKGVPIYGGDIKGELCTPTGAAILKHFVREFRSMPPMVMERIGYGIGSKEFECSNSLRSVLGK